MTDYSELKAGRELDILIAEKIFDLIPCQAEIHKTHPWPCYAEKEHPMEGGDLEGYSRNDESAELILQELASDECLFAMTYCQATPRWSVRIVRLSTKEDPLVSAHARADTRPLAICRAALEFYEKLSKGE